MRVLQTALGQMNVSKGGKGGVIINTASSAGEGAFQTLCVKSTNHRVIKHLIKYGFMLII